MKDVDLTKLREKGHPSIMSEDRSKDIDESKMTFSYLDIVGLRLLYE